MAARFTARTPSSDTRTIRVAEYRRIYVHKLEGTGKNFLFFFPRLGGTAPRLCEREGDYVERRRAPRSNMASSDEATEPLQTSGADDVSGASLTGVDRLNAAVSRKVSSTALHGQGPDGNSSG